MLTLLVICYYVVIIAISYNVIDGLQFNHIPFAFNPQTCHNNQYQYQLQIISTIDNPLCFQSWIVQDIQFIANEFHHMISNFQDIWMSSSSSLNTSSTMEICRTHYVIADKRMNSFVHHFPHFAQIYFRYFSLIIWQHRIYHYLYHTHHDSFVQEIYHHVNNNKNDIYSEFDDNNHLINTTIICLKHILFEHQASLWNHDQTSHTWQKDLVQIIDHHWHIQSIQSEYCIKKANKQSTNQLSLKSFLPSIKTSTTSSTTTTTTTPKLTLEGSWFIHPTDAILLTSLILNQSPCKYQQQAHFLLSKSLEVGLLGRVQTRQIGNPIEVIDLLKHFKSDNISLFTTEKLSKIIQRNITTTKSNIQGQIIFMEGLTFKEQVYFTSSIDILITIHGAGETNIAFMKPCSIVIEIFPFSFDVSGYFQGLAKSAGLLHYYWLESYQHTIQIEHYKLKPNCKTMIQHLIHGKYSIIMKQNYSMNINHDDAIYADEITIKHCVENGECRSCTRDVDAVLIDTFKLNKILKQAIEDRRHCILTNPYYN